MWGVIWALQSFSAVHLGVDNLGVVRHVGRLLDGHPFELVKDGDLLLLIERMLRFRGLDMVRITKIKGHADQGIVLDGRVREIDRLGNNAADGPPGIWDSEWENVRASASIADDVAHWPYTTGLLVKWVAFPGTLHWPAGGSDLRIGVFLFFELLILDELRAGERLSLERAVLRYLRAKRPISVSAVPFGPGIDIWRSCHFIGALMRFLCLLPGELG